MKMEPDMESVTFKLSPQLADILRRTAFDLDRSAREVLRACLSLGLPLVKEIRGLDRVAAEDIRSIGFVSKNMERPE